MKTIRFISILAAAVMMLFSCQSGPSYVKVEDGKFVSKDYPSHFLGANMWYGAILASDGEGGDIERLEAELDTLKALGLTNLRILVGADGPDGVRSTVQPTLQKEPGVYNDTIFLGLDRLLAEMGERGMKAVLYLNNSWGWSGGYGRYLQWANEGDEAAPAEGRRRQRPGDFLMNERAKELFADHVRHVVSRINTVTGKPYSEDPAIFSWQIGNEPRCFSSDPANQQAFVDWIWSTASLIKSIDPNHMVSTGSEGQMGCEGSMELFEKIHACPDVDYMNIHIWPYNWRWVKAESLREDLRNAIAKTDEYIDAHLEIAGKYGKPVVLEEFGFPRDDFKFAQGTPVRNRNMYYRHVFNRVVESAKEGGLFAGVNFWAWGGFAGQSETNIFWQPGDDYCGDPAQEQQGLNSVYVGDVSTIRTIMTAYADLEKALKPAGSFDLSANDGIFDKETANEIVIKMTYPEDITVNVELALNTDFGEEVAVYEEKVKIVDGETVFTVAADMKPGFYNAVLSLVEKDGRRIEIARSNIGCLPDQISSPQDKQPDFDQFWEKTLAELAAVEPEYKLTLIPEQSNDIRRTYRVDMKSFGGEPISGIYVEPVAPGKYPAMVHYMGYGSDVHKIDPSASPEMSEFLLCIRGQALNVKPGAPRNWVTQGLDSEYTYYYRGAFADAVRAVDFICSREKTDLTKVFAQGESQGGALTFAAASLDQRIKALAPSAPFLCDYPDYMELASWPSNEWRAKAKELGMSHEEMLRVLSYFDIKNLTDRIKCPMLMAIGLQDVTCPPHTNFAGYNMAQGEKSWICYPYTGHSVWQVQEWAKEKEEFFKKFL